MNLWVSILLISICAIFWDIGVAFQKKTVDGMPKLEILKPARESFKILLHSPKWIVGLISSTFLLSRFTTEEVAEKL